MSDTPPATSAAVEVTVVVVTYQSAEVLPACLESLPAGLKGIKGWHLVVADNASDDGSAHVADDDQTRGDGVGDGPKRRLRRGHQRRGGEGAPE